MVLRDPSTFHMLVHHVSEACRGYKQAMQGRQGPHKRCYRLAGGGTAARPCMQHAKHGRTAVSTATHLCALSPSHPCQYGCCSLSRLLPQVIRRLEAVTEEQQLPKDDRELVFATRLLQLAVGCRGMMRDRQYRFAGKAALSWRLQYCAPCTFSGLRAMCCAVVYDYLYDCTPAALPNLAVICWLAALLPAMPSLRPRRLPLPLTFHRPPCAACRRQPRAGDDFLPHPVSPHAGCDAAQGRGGGRGRGRRHRSRGGGSGGGGRGAR